MTPQNNQLDFKGQSFFIGIDVHKNNWSVTIRTRDLELKTLSMNPNPEELAHYLRRRYPGGNYHSVYEAGFCGFWIHRRLQALGIDNIVVHPADVPTTRKEKDQKRDPIDSRKLSRELASGSLKGIWIPATFHEELRSLSRLRHKTVRHQSRVKNRIKGLLHYYGIPIPNRVEVSPWSGVFLNWLKELTFNHEPARYCLLTSIQELINTKQQIADIVRELRRYSRQPGIKEIVRDVLMTIPGVGFILAMTLYAEIADARRFRRFDHMACYVGLVPSVSSSGDKENIRGITERHNGYLRYLLIEAAWIAVRTDPVLTDAYCTLIRRMSKQEAIIRIAKRLLSRMRCVWINQQPYVEGIC
jgi:transposase